jgi:hypothetical protein
MRFCSAAAFSMVALLTAGAAQAETVHYIATLTGADEVPANASAGRGTFTAELETDEKTLVYRATYSGLTGPATMAHIHGPAAPGANAPPIVVAPFATNPISGATILTDDQIEALRAGKLYFNIHTEANPTGEIRGQIKPN